MGKVINLHGVTRLDIPPDRVLQGQHGKLEHVVVIGWDKDGNESFSSSIADGAQVLWLLERCKKAILDIDDA